MLQQVAQIGDALETHSALKQPVEGQQLGGFSQPPPAFGQGRRQRQAAAKPPTHRRAGKAGQLGRQPRPLQQLKGLRFNRQQAACAQASPCTCSGPAAPAIGAAPTLEGMPPIGS